MKFDKLKHSIGQRVRLRPAPKRWDGDKRVTIDDPWTLSEVDRARLVLTRAKSKQVLCLAPDHIHSYTSSSPGDSSFDGFLELKVTVDLTEATPTIDIIPSGSARTLTEEDSPALSSRIRCLLDRINPRISDAFDRGTPIVAVMISVGNLVELRAVLQENEASKVVSIESNGSVAMGRGARIGGHIHDLEEGNQQGFLVSKGPDWSPLVAIVDYPSVE
jgi:hypothetical protein